MFERFCSAYLRDPAPRDSAAVENQHRVHPALDDSHRGYRELRHFRDETGGASFCNGLYRTVSDADHALFVARVAQAFPGFAGRIFPLAFDWLNRIFCADFDRIVDAKPQLLIFSHLNDRVFDMPVDIDYFHNVDLIEQRNGLLESDLFEQFLRNQQLAQLPYSQCAGFALPLFLDGEYELANMELNDVEVEWELTAQMLVQVRAMTAGARVGSVSIEQP